MVSMIKLVIFNRFLVVRLLFCVCLIAGCVQISKAQGTESKISLEPNPVSLETKKPNGVERQSEKKGFKAKEVSKVRLEKTAEEKKVEKEVLKWCKRIEWKCIGDDTNPIGWLIGGELHKLRELGKPAIPTLIEVFCDKDRKWMMRYFLGNEVLDSFAEEIKDERYIEILKVLEDRTDHEAARMIAARVIGSSKDKRAVEPLIKLLESEDNRRVRLEIVWGLGAFFDEKRAIKPLIKVLNNENEDGGIRYSAAVALGNVGGKEVVEILIDTLKRTKNTDVSSGVIFSLSRSKSGKAVEPLIDLLRRGTLGISEPLGNLWKEGIHDDRIIEAMIEGLRQEDELMKMMIAKTLGEMGDKRAIKPLEKTLEEVKKGNKDVIANALKKLTGKDYKY